MANAYNHWTDDQKRFVLENYLKMTLEELAQRLGNGRTGAQVSSLLTSLNLRKGNVRNSPVKVTPIPAPLKPAVNHDHRKKKAPMHGSPILAEISELLIHEVNIRKLTVGTYNDRRGK